MAPMIRAGDICEFEPLFHLDDLKVGDILLYVSHTGELIGHRYLGTTIRDRQTRLICKGDFNRNADPPISPDQVVGRMKTNSYRKLWGHLMGYFPFISVGIQKIYRKGRNRWQYL